MNLGNNSLKIDRVYLCIKTVRMEEDGELAYQRGKFYKSEAESCLTDESGCIYHYWETKIDKYFILWNGKQHRAYIRCHQIEKKI